MIFEPNRDLIINSLKNGIVNVKFTKVDGSEREMKCTLNEALIPVSNTTDKTIEETRVKEPNINTISVWDIENEGWRSFRVASVIYVSV